MLFTIRMLCMQALAISFYLKHTSADSTPQNPVANDSPAPVVAKDNSGTPVASDKEVGDKKDGEKKDADKKDADKKDGEKKDGEKKDGEKKDGKFMATIKKYKWGFMIGGAVVILLICGGVAYFLYAKKN